MIVAATEEAPMNNSMFRASDEDRARTVATLHARVAHEAGPR